MMFEAKIFAQACSSSKWQK